MTFRFATLICLSSILAACGSDTPTEPSATSRVSVEAATASSGTVVIPATYVYNEIGGVVLPPQSGLMSVRANLSSGRAADYAQLNVYLLTGGTNTEYCGQNLPDSPTWRSIPAGWSTTVTVTGFQVFRVPCTVTGMRVMLHTRGGGLGPPPTAGETIAEATFPVSFQIRLQGQ